MKKTKLFTTLAALALVLGLGACDGGSSDEPTSSDDGGTTDSEGGTTEAVTLSNYTVAFSFVDEDGEATTLPEYASAYIIGDWDSWGAFLPLTEVDGVYSYTFSSIAVGTYEYKGVTWYSDETVSWNNCVEIITDGTGNAKLTVSESEGDGYTQKVEVTLTATLEEKPEPVVTYVITIGSLGAAPEGIVLYAAGNFNAATADGQWGDPVLLTNNGDGTYNFVLYELPTSGRSFEILADDTTDEDQDMWNYILGSHTFTAEEAAGTSVDITVTTTYTSWFEDGGVFPPLGEEEEEFYVAFINGDTGTVDYDLTYTADIDCWDGGSCTASQTTISDGHYAFYSDVAKYASGASTKFVISYDGHSQTTTSAVTIPSNEEGTPIYIGICWINGWLDDSEYTNWDVKTNIAAAGWQYIPSGTTVQAFLNSYTVSAYW